MYEELKARLKSRYMDIKEIALKVAKKMREESEYDVLDLVCNAEDFAEALVAELAKENEPVYYLWENKFGDPQQMLSSNPGPHPEYVITTLCTLPPTASKIEQETTAAWQPIETAPKDEDLIVTDGNNVALGRWVGRYFAWGYGADPTHWMPLPTPPKRSMEGV